MASVKRFNHVVYPSFLGGKSIKVYVREQSQDLAQINVLYGLTLFMESVLYGFFIQSLQKLTLVLYDSHPRLSCL